MLFDLIALIWDGNHSSGCGTRSDSCFGSGGHVEDDSTGGTSNDSCCEIIGCVGKTSSDRC